MAKSSASAATARLARRIASSLAKKQVPEMSPELEDFLADPPAGVLATLRGFVAQARADTARGTSIAPGYLYLLQGQLERIRYRLDSGYADAAASIDAFQRALADDVTASRIDSQSLTLVTGALHQAGVEVTDELRAAVAASAEALLDEAPERLASLGSGIETVAELLGGDPFAIVAMLAETGHAMPVETRAEMAHALACGAQPSLNETGALLTLDPLPDVRAAAAAGLQTNAASLSPAALRRLIAVRNWVPQAERKRLDAVIRAARAAGVECAPWPAGALDRILASAVDGSGAHGLLLISPAGKRRVLSSLLFRQGVRDAYTASPESARTLERALAQANAATPLLEVPVEHADRLVRHHLAAGLADGKPPPIGLLQVAETTRRDAWHPEPIDWAAALAPIIAGAPPRLSSQAGVAAMLRDEAPTAMLDGIEESWFLDDPEARDAMDARHFDDAVDALLDSVLERRRKEWAELLGVTALRLHDASAGRDPRAPRVALIARAILDDVKLRDIVVMRDVAMRSVAMARLARSARR
jgi:hypothetical protein